MSWSGAIGRAYKSSNWPDPLTADKKPILTGGSAIGGGALTVQGLTSTDEAKGTSSPGRSYLPNLVSASPYNGAPPTAIAFGAPLGTTTMEAVLDAPDSPP